MKATSIKQIKFNRGQVSDMLSERVDMGLQNACGTVYDNIYINKYGQIQNAPVPILCHDDDFDFDLVHMFDTGDDAVYPITIQTNSDSTGIDVKVWSPVSKTNKYSRTNFTTPLATQTITGMFRGGYKTLQFGYNVLFFGQTRKPWILNLVPQHSAWDSYVTLTVKPNYFDKSFDNIYVRGLDTGTPSDFTVPTSGNYKIADQTAITTGRYVTIDRNGAGSDFTQSLVGQVIQCRANGGAVQVRSVENANRLTAEVLSPISALAANTTEIVIPWSANNSEWIFGYEKPYGATAGANNNPSWPDSAIYTNQRLIFGGNDYHGSLISVSRIGVINDFDPESATESDAFTTAIASKDFCRIVDFIVSNNELRVACTNGEYAMALSNLTPSGSLNGFDLRSEVGIATGTPICDCGGITTYVSKFRDAIYGTQFSLLRDRYQPISLTSQTSGIVDNVSELVYLTNRAGSEGNCLVGLNGDAGLCVGNIDLNAGLIGLSKIKTFGIGYPKEAENNIRLLNLFATGDALWGVIATNYSPTITIQYYNKYLVRFGFGELFAFPCWFRYYPSGSIIPPGNTHPNELVLPLGIGNFARLHPEFMFRALCYSPTQDTYTFVSPTGYTYNVDNTYTVNFADSVVKENIVCAGFVRQSDWRSVEIGVGIATREINKRIIKLEGVIEPTQITGQGRFAGLTLTPEQAKNFITLTRSKDVETMDVDNLSNTSYTENEDLVWRRAFDNPDRELHYGVSMVAPFLIKSLTVTIEYDEVA